MGSLSPTCQPNPFPPFVLKLEKRCDKMSEEYFLLTLTWVIPLSILVAVLIDYMLFKIWHYNAHKND